MMESNGHHFMSSISISNSVFLYGVHIQPIRESIQIQRFDFYNGYVDTKTWSTGSACLSTNVGLKLYMAWVSNSEARQVPAVPI